MIHLALAFEIPQTIVILVVVFGPLLLTYSMIRFIREIAKSENAKSENAKSDKK